MNRILPLLLGIAVALTTKSQTLNDGDSGAQLNQFSRAIQSLSLRVSPAVVRITTTRLGSQEDSGRTDVPIGKQQSIGSGVIVDSDGYILTNAHVVDGAQRIKVDMVATGEQTIPGVLARSHMQPQDATIVGAFTEADIAVIKVDKTGLPTLPFAEYGKLQQGQVVFALGSPEGLQNSISMGIVSSIARQPDPDSPFLYIQTDTPINPGNSGGPLINTAGEIVGLNTFILSQSGGNEGVGFAIPSTLLRWVVGNIKKYGHIHRSTVGIGLQAITPTLARALKLPRDSGVMISDVTPGGPAETAGLKLNDVIVALDGRPVDAVPAMLGLFFQHGGGDHIRFDLLRADQKIVVDLVAVEQPHESDRIGDFVDPVKDVIPPLGIIGVTLTQRLEAITGPTRLPTGIVVAARMQTSSVLELPLHTGDIIHSLNDKFVYTVQDLNAALANLKQGSPVALLIERHGQLQYVAFEL